MKTLLTTPHYRGSTCPTIVEPHSTLCNSEISRVSNLLLHKKRVPSCTSLLVLSKISNGVHNFVAIQTQMASRNISLWCEVPRLNASYRLTAVDAELQQLHPTPRSSDIYSEELDSGTLGNIEDYGFREARW
jgi:hypothetical protein